jgi:hypothetical protein
MSDTARIHSIDAVMAFKTSMVKFTEIANVALSSAEGELRRMMVWLESEQLMHWQTQIRKRQEALTRAKDAVRQKMLYPDSTGRTPTPVEEWKQQKICQQRLEEAEQKLVNTRRAIRLLEKEMQVYKGSVQRFATMVQSDVPRATERLDRAFGHLETYVSMTAPSMGPAVAAGSAESAWGDADETTSMARPEEDLASRSTGVSPVLDSSGTGETPVLQDAPLRKGDGTTEEQT